MSRPVPDVISDTVRQLWLRPGPKPANSFESAEFLALKAACVAEYQIATPFWFTMSLWEILRALGCPVLLPRGKHDVATSWEEAAFRLHATLTAQAADVVHLCPLDWADSPMPVTFGSNRLGRFTAAELRSLADAPRLERVFPDAAHDWDSMAEFYWLVVRETAPISADPGQRTTPFVYDMQADLGAITAHEERYPSAVEDALFMLLLAPWEDWAEAMEVDWRGFKVPWTYSVTDDLCVRTTNMPKSDTLTWVPYIHTDPYGEPIEQDEPAHYNLGEGALLLADFVNDAGWDRIQRARSSPLFETPVRHFLVRAFHSSGIDEFMAHLTVFEAALGLSSDFGGKPKGDPRFGKTATKIMAQRISALLEDPGAAAEFEELFKLRSAYVHGRSMAQISSGDRFRARRLARRTVVALVGRAVDPIHIITERETFLLGLSRDPRQP